MVSEIQDATTLEATEVWVPEFGLLDTKNIQPGKRYQGRLYRLPADAVKTLSELVGFTAKFEAPSIRTAYLDVLKTEGTVCLEIDRNTSPQELGLRYGRDRWSSVEPANKAAQALRPWIKTHYVARFLPEKVLFTLTEQLKIKFDEREHFLIRIDLKDRVVGLIAEDQHVEEFPAGAFEVFALPQGHVPIVPTQSVSDAPEGAPEAPRASAQPSALDPGVKYATYSKSEIDRMFKLQTESITNALSAKISGQQRLFQDAVEAQEKTIAKISDKMVANIEETRSKLEANTKKAQESGQVQLDEFRKQLTAELEQFRSHINKNVIPISKTIEDKVKSFEVAAAKTGREDIKPFLLAVAGGVSAVVVVCAIALFASLPKAGEVSEIKADLARVIDKANK